MDCQEIKELLDACALGAADEREAGLLEEHVADCLRCWEELTEAQQVAALLSLSVALERAPGSLGERIMARAEREARPQRGLATAGRALAGPARGWRKAAAGLAVAGIAGVLALVVFLQVEINDLRDENNALERQVQQAGTLAEEQRQITAVLSAPDVERVEMAAVSPGVVASAMYHWTVSAKKGFIAWHGLPPLEAGRVYQVWFTTDGEAVSMGTFEAWDEAGQMPMDLSSLHQRPDGVGISVEAAGGSSQPTTDWVLYAEFLRE